MSQDERVSLVDKNDKIIGSKWRSELTDEDCWRMISVWIENNKGEVLLQKRSASKKNSPNVWTPGVDGTVAEGEDCDKTAEREMREELNLTDVHIVKANKVHVRHDFGWRLQQGYKVTRDQPIAKFTIQAEEVADLQWVDKQQVLDEITGKTPHTRLWPDSCKYWPELFDLK